MDLIAKSDFYMFPRRILYSIYTLDAFFTYSFLYSSLCPLSSRSSEC